MSKPDIASMTFSTDGIQPHKSSPFSIWPVALTINELGYRLKHKFLIYHSLYAGNTKPTKRYVKSSCYGNEKSFYD